MTDSRPQWWLAAVDQHGNPTLIDGAHDAREGCEHAAHLFDQLNLTRGRALAVAQMLLTAVVADEPTGGSTESTATPWNMNVKPERSDI